MENLFKLSGVPQAAIAMIPQVIETCRECRPWMQKESEPTPVVEIVTQLNMVVEADILFYNEYMVWPMLDRADRWHAGCELTNKNAELIQEAIDVVWLQIHGPFKTLVIDGESAVNSDSTKAFLQRKGIELYIRAPNQHARMLERRGAVLRHTMHGAETQLQREGIKCTFKQLLAEAVFAGNALVNVGNTTPYNTRYGRQPALLPDVGALADDAADGGGRLTHRVREVAVQRMVEATAVARMRRAGRTKTTTPGQERDFKPGELVDVYRQPSAKDDSGWHGP